MSYMNRAPGTAEILWEVQDLRERLLLARAEQVKMERLIREIVRDPRNREMVFGHGFTPFYTWPSEAVADLREMSRLVYLIYPTRKNRIKPEVLMRQYQDKVAVVENLVEYLAAAEVRAHAAGIDTAEALPGEF
jgi:hypothetical protein